MSDSESQASKKKKKKEFRDFYAEILEYLSNHPSGSIIKDIANGIKASRTTVSKYIYRLHLEKKIIKKQFGAYYLHFSADKKFVSHKLLNDYYKGLLYGLKKKFPDHYETFKKVGRELAQQYQLSWEYLPRFDEEFDIIKNLTAKNFLKIFSEFYPYFDVYQQPVEVTDLEINLEKSTAKYRFHNSSLLQGNDDFIYHFNIVCGFIEGTASRIFNKNVICNIENIEISAKTGKSYVDISIKII